MKNKKNSQAEQVKLNDELSPEAYLARDLEVHQRKLGDVSGSAPLGVLSNEEKKKIIDDFKKQQKDLEKLYEEVIKNLKIARKEKSDKNYEVEND